jgi:hypothetical protein
MRSLKYKNTAENEAIVLCAKLSKNSVFILQNSRFHDYYYAISCSMPCLSIVWHLDGRQNQLQTQLPFSS